MNYIIAVTSLSFSPDTPHGIAVAPGGSVAETITAIGLPSGGVYSGGGTTDLLTGGSFSVIDPVTGEFTFAGAVNPGVAFVDMVNINEAKKAIEKLNGTKFSGRTIKVSMANTQNFVDNSNLPRTRKSPKFVDNESRK